MTVREETEYSNWVVSKKHVDQSRDACRTKHIVLGGGYRTSDTWSKFVDDVCGIIDKNGTP